MITNLKPYPAYRDSGVPWLGKVPEHWEVLRLINCISNIECGSREQGDADSDNGVPNFGGEHIGKDGNLLLRNLRYVSQTYYKQLNKGKINKGDILLVKDGATIGKVTYIKSMPFPECSVNEHVYILRASINCISSFLYKIFRSSYIQEDIWQHVTGSAQPGLTSSFLRKIFSPLPPLPEQALIVRFLDWTERRLRKAISLRQKRIKLLEEYKQALINEAVTGKIDVRTGKPYPAYKDSGVEWLGKVPKHWEVRPVKRYYDIQLGKMLQPRPNSADDTEVPYLKAQHIQWFSVKTSDIPRMWASSKDIRQFGITVGDLLVCEGGEGGRCGIVKEIPDGFIIQNALHRVRPRDHCRNEYLQYVMRVIATTGWFDALNNKATIAHFTREKFGALCISIPPLPEQAAIVEYIDAKCAKIDSAITSDRKVIEFLKEFRTRLIADVVTGKLDVRDVAEKMPEEPEEDMEPIEEETEEKEASEIDALSEEETDE